MPTRGHILVGAGIHPPVFADAAGAPCIPRSLCFRLPTLSAEQTRRRAWCAAQLAAGNGWRESSCGSCSFERSGSNERAAGLTPCIATSPQAGSFLASWVFRKKDAHRQTAAALSTAHAVHPGGGRAKKHFVSRHVVYRRSLRQETKNHACLLLVSRLLKLLQLLGGGALCASFFRPGQQCYDPRKHRHAAKRRKDPWEKPLVQAKAQSGEA